MKEKNVTLPDEFDDVNGIKWIQTTPDDFFSSSELVSIFKKIQSEKKETERLFAYTAIGTLDEAYLRKIDELEKSLAAKDRKIASILTQCRAIIDRKNKKMKGLLVLLSKIKKALDAKGIDYTGLEKFISEDMLIAAGRMKEESSKIDDLGSDSGHKFQDVEEIFLDGEGNELPQ